MDDLKKFTEQQLIERAKSYHQRLDVLMHDISKYMNISKGYKESIKNEYADLKKHITEEYRYFSANKNDIMDISKIHNCYQSAILEASANGFSAKVNSNINQNMFSSLDDADYYIIYYLGEYI